MDKKGTASIKRGQAITFRLPSDTPDHLIRQLQRLKETERRNFSSKIAEFALEGVRNSLSKERETVTIPLPKSLSKEQRNWLKHAHSEALLGSIVYQLLMDPIRATAVLASLNSNSMDIDEALYLQETDLHHVPSMDQEEDLPQVPEVVEEEPVKKGMDLDDDLLHFDLDQARQELAASTTDDTSEEVPDEYEEAEDIIGDFLAKMNK